MINGEVPEDNQNGHGTEELELSNMYKAYVSGLNFIGNDPRKYGPKYATDVLTYLHVLDPEILIDWENPWNLTIFCGPSTGAIQQIFHEVQTRRARQGRSSSTTFDG